jgi:hypothetical protein
MYGGTSRFESSFTGESTELESCQIFCSIISDASYETKRNITARLLGVRHLFVLLYCRVLTGSCKFQHNLIMLLDIITFKTT